MNELSSEQPLSVAIANDFDIVVAGMAALLAPCSDRVRVVELMVGDDERTVDEPVDIVLFDTFGRSDIGMADLHLLLDGPWAHHVVVFTWERRTDLIERAFAAGASGWISKGVSAEALVDALERVVHSQPIVVAASSPAPRNSEGRDWPGRVLGLSERESEVLAALVAGKRNSEIAHELLIGIETVKSHLRRIYLTLGARNRVEAVTRALATPDFVRLRPPVRHNAHH